MDDPVKKTKAAQGGTGQRAARKPRADVPLAGSNAGAADTNSTAVPAKVAPKAAVKANAAAVAGKQESASKAGKAKLVQGTFTLPKDEYAVLAELKKSALKNGVAVKKSQLLRVAITLLRDLDQPRLGAMVAALPVAKPPRAKKQK